MVYIVLADGFEEIEAIAPYDVLKRGGVQVKYAYIGAPVVTGSHGVRIEAECGIDAACDGEMIVIPGGMRGVNNLLASEKTVELVKKYYDAGKHVAAICAGPMVLTKAGVLSGKKAVCYPGLEDRMSGNMSQEENTVTDGRVTTSRAAGSATEFGLRLLSLLKGEAEAERVRAEIHYAE